jgi:hypothetical protein
MNEPHEPTPQPPRQRHGKEYEDNHFHDEDEVAPPPEEAPRQPGSRPAPRLGAKLPPRPRRFPDD